ncbi:MAG: hypothetical protein QOG33_238 [Gaiellales bacterium]|nr:hypothetical protein [Gaiellales bacterium]
MHGLTLILLICALGAYHGANPAMGWLFAVSLGMQDGSRRSVVRALPAIAVGHELSVIVVAAVISTFGLLASPAVLQVAAAAALILFGGFRFLRPRWHPRWTRMRVRGRELVAWSFLMSSAHGAGLMLAPLLIAGAASGGHHDLLSGTRLDFPETALLVTLHGAVMIGVTSAVALGVYSRFSTTLLRRIWPNLDGVWAAAFVVSGTFALLTA